MPSNAVFFKELLSKGGVVCGPKAKELPLVNMLRHVNFHSAQHDIFHSAKLLIVVCSADRQSKLVVGQPR